MPVVVALAAAAHLGNAMSQVAGGAGDAFKLPPIAGSAPFGAPGAELIVTRFQFDGNRALPTADLDALAEPYLNRPLRTLDVEDLRQRITRAYIDRGFVSSGALIGGEAYRDGVLRITIVEGRVTQLRANGMQGLSDAYLATRLFRPDEALDVNVLQERFQLLLTDPLFERLNARLMPGASTGTSIIDIDVKRARPWQIEAFANNYLAPAVGSTVAGVTTSVRNITTLGDTLNFTLSRSRGSTNGDFAWSVPLGAGATTLAVHLAEGSSSVIEEPLTSLDIASIVRSREATLSHPFIDETRRRFTLGLGYGERSNDITLGGQPFSFTAGESTGSTRVRAWRFFQDLTMRLGRHVLALRSTFVAGHNNLPQDAGVAMQANPSYHLWTGQAQASIAAGDGGALVLLRSTMQRSANRLVSLEQFSVGGRYTVRGYRENQLVRDEGYAASAELHWPLWRGDSERAALTLIPFIDLGSAHNRDEAGSRLASAGIGLQWKVADFEGELFYARRLEQRAIDTHGDLQDRGIHVAIRYRGF